jgi:hypothetical protein
VTVRPFDKLTASKLTAGRAAERGTYGAWSAAHGRDS